MRKKVLSVLSGLLVVLAILAIYSSLQVRATWAFVLEQPQPDQTRLIVRGRVAPNYRPYGLPEWVALPAGRSAHFIMQRKQLLGIARRVEASQQLVRIAAPG